MLIFILNCTYLKQECPVSLGGGGGGIKLVFNPTTGVCDNTTPPITSSCLQYKL